MRTMNIVLSPDPGLRQVCEPCQVGDKSLKKLAKQMLNTMYANNGCGLAAPQVGILRRVCIVEYDDKRYELVNPTLVHASGKCVDNEGCLSVPGYRGLVERPEVIDVKYFDRNGKPQEIHAEGYFARVFLHEMDHLDGILFCDKMIKKIMDD